MQCGVFAWYAMEYDNECSPNVFKEAQYSYAMDGIRLRMQSQRF